MIYITKQEAGRVIEWVNGYPMTYGDYLDNTEQAFVIIDATDDEA